MHTYKLRLSNISSRTLKGSQSRTHIYVIYFEMNLIEKNDAMWWLKVVGGSVLASVGTYLVWKKNGKSKR